MEHEDYMREALSLSREAAQEGEVPVGCVIVKDGEIIGRGRNRREELQRTSSHAEMEAIAQANERLRSWRLDGCTLYVTLEPCCMCAGLMVNARVGRCAYGATDAKAGALGSLYDLNADSRLNHRFNVTAGVLAGECREVLSSYFAGLRGVDGVGCGLNLEAHASHAEALAGVGDLADETVDFGPVQRRPRRVLLAIDSFKGSVSSAQAEEAVAEGMRRVWPDAELNALPLADGGEGTLDAIAARGGELSTCEVAGPLDYRVSARMLVDGEHESAVIEMAESAGIGYSPCTESAALAATTYGVGELMLRAVRAGVKTIYIGLGGSATNDAGLGMLQALGFRFLDKRGNLLGTGGRIMSQVASIDTSAVHPALKEARFTIACDVRNPFCGSDGAAYVFASQKGADAKMVKELDTGMQALSRVILSTTGKDISDIPGAGAAGGMGGGFLAFLNAELKPGIRLMLDVLDFGKRITGADLIFTGEGRADRQTVMGKVPSGILEEARKQNIPVIVLAGSIEDAAQMNRAGFQGIFSITPGPVTMEKAMEPEFARENIRRLVTQICSVIHPFATR